MVNKKSLLPKKLKHYKIKDEEFTMLYRIRIERFLVETDIRKRGNNAKKN